jgi:hypothetical protein
MEQHEDPACFDWLLECVELSLCSAEGEESVLDVDVDLGRGPFPELEDEPNRSPDPDLLDPSAHQELELIRSHEQAESPRAELAAGLRCGP